MERNFASRIARTLTPWRCPFGGDATAAGFEVFLKLLFEKEAAHRAESDEAVRTFIATSKWPKQSAWAEYITWLRVFCASEFVCQLLANDHSRLVLSIPHDADRATIQTWLFFDHWERCFDVWLKLEAVSVFYRLPFYGLTPADE